MATTLEQTATGPRSAEEERLLALRKREIRQRWFWRIAGYVFFIAAWAVVSRIVGENLIPGPVRIIETIPQLIESGRFFSSFGATLTRIGIG
ncbi:MAG TPA: hypothetical protein VNT92_06140, partial [Acidimicrobiia bacterium]|nr:hypothetical protein [Acidimicrobiia bacterium]